MNNEQRIKLVKQNAVRIGLILLNDKSMPPADRRLFAQRTIEAAAVQVERLGG